MPILTQVSESAIADLEWPNYRSQRWGSEHQGFVRPIRWICSLLGSEVVPVTYADVTSSNTTRGHRVLGPGEHVVACPADYEATLEAAGVLLADRRDKAIRAGIEKVQAQRPGCVVDTPKGTYAEVVNLCEWPTVLVGVFDEEFLRVPHEIICESMQVKAIAGATADLIKQGFNPKPEIMDALLTGIVTSAYSERAGTRPIASSSGAISVPSAGFHL